MKNLFLTVLLASLVTSGCVYHRYYDADGKNWGETEIAVLPFTDLTEYPHAGLIVTELFRTELGVRSFRIVPDATVKKAINADMKPEVDPLKIGKALKVPYVAVGSVTEYRYKFSLDGEPAVGITAAIIGVDDAKIYWQGSASKAGFGCDTLNRVAQIVCENLAGNIPWQN